MPRFQAPPILHQRRVVVTGLGAVSPLGNGVQHCWDALLSGKSGVRQLPEDHHVKKWKHASKLPTTIAGIVPVGSIAGQLDLAAHGKVPRFIAYALEAAQEAICMSGWQAEADHDGDRAGVVLGSGIGCLDDTVDALAAMDQGGVRKLTPQYVPRILINLAAGHVSIKHGLRGPNHAPATACATGAHAIGDAYRFIKHGDADVMVAGGTEASVNPLALAGFGRMRALSTQHNDTPEAASRPFDAARDGFVLAEGAAVMVLEELSHAQRRGATVLAEIRGYGLSADACHITAPPEDGRGAYRAMRAALDQSGLHADDIDYVNAHATSTPLGDLAEARAISRLLGDRQSLLVSSTKGATGHLLGAAGALEAAFTVLAIKSSAVPHTLNLKDTDEAVRHTGLHLVQGSPVMQTVQAAVSNAFGFGGTNVSLVFTGM